MLLGWGAHASTWELLEKIRFDKVNRVIYVVPGTTQLDIKADLYSGIKRWGVSHPDNTNMDFPIRTIGGDATSGAESAGDIYFLQNGWRLSVDFSETAVVGVLFSDDFDTPYLTPDLVPQFSAQASSLVNSISTIETVVNEDALTPINDNLGTVLTNQGDLLINQGDMLNNQATIAAINVLVRKLLTNRVQVSGDDLVTTVFDDDKITPILIFDHIDPRNRDPR